jgi:hypothetical protein
MGYNTVILLLNDQMHELEKAPHALTFAITHPPHSDKYEHLEKYWWPQVMSVAKDHGEDASCFRNALTVLPTYHADDKHILVAGWNSLIRLTREQFGKHDRKNNKITISLPGYWIR